MKKLPIGEANFEELIRRGNVYVDKTPLIYKLVNEGKFYFLSRPRRFGKSLLLSTIEHLFQGHRELFEGLWIEQADWDWQAHPVVKFDFSAIASDNPDVLRESLMNEIDKIGANFGVTRTTNILRNAFAYLIIDVAKSVEQSVVVLIDEYDQPLISHLGKGEADLEIAKQNRDVLRDFFGVLKAGHVNDVLRFVFITGISKFSRVSIFSELNNLDDLTMRDSYVTLLGYTEEEIAHFFAEHLEQLSRNHQTPVETILAQIREWYNGYRFTENAEPVYNPFSVLNVLKEGKFQNYWFETATPAFLVNLMKEKKYPVPDIENLRMRQSVFSTYDLDNLRLEALLFQTGYLTIKGYDGLLYRLSYPNQEVKVSFTEYLYDQLVEIEDVSIREQYVLLHEHLAEGRLPEFIEIVNSILSSIPYVHIYDQDERYYHTVFYLMLSASGAPVHTEVLTSRGRIDMAVEFADRVYIIELKCNQSAAEALKQIREKGYAEKYRGSGKEILLVGINFDTGQRRVIEWESESVASVT